MTPAHRAALKKQLHLEYESAVKAATHAVFMRYNSAVERKSPEGNGYHIGYRSGRFDENQRLERLHAALLEVASSASLSMLDGSKAAEDNLTAALDALKGLVKL